MVFKVKRKVIKRDWLKSSYLESDFFDSLLEVCFQRSQDSCGNRHEDSCCHSFWASFLK